MFGDDYHKELAGWQIAHGADRHDMTPAQDRRYRAWNRIADAGLDPKRAVYARLIIKRGVVTDDR